MLSRMAVCNLFRSSSTPAHACLAASLDVQLYEAGLFPSPYTYSAHSSSISFQKSGPWAIPWFLCPAPEAVLLLHQFVSVSLPIFASSGHAEIAAPVSNVHLFQPSGSRCGDPPSVSNDATSRELEEPVPAVVPQLHLRLLVPQSLCSLACDVLRFSFTSFVLSSTGVWLILWIRPTFCVLRWPFLPQCQQTASLTFFLDVLTITLSFLALVAFLASFASIAKAVHLNQI